MAGTVSRVARRRSPSSARRALGSFTRILERLILSESETPPGVLGTLDPRSKLVGSGILLVAASLLHNPAAIGVCWAVCTAAAVAAGVGARRLVGLVAIPVLFSFAVAAPALLNIVTPGVPIITICSLPRELGPVRLPRILAVTDSGVVVAGRLVLRVAACVTIVALPILTTRRHRIIQSLGALGVPGVFVSVLTMMERYLEVLVRAAQQIHLAKISRTIESPGIRQEHAWVAAGIGALYRRSRTMAEDVYAAMLARGFTGGHRRAPNAHLAARDWAFLTACAVFGTALIVWERSL